VDGEAISDLRFNISEFGLKERKSQPRAGAVRNKTAREETPPLAKGEDSGAKYFICGANGSCGKGEREHSGFSSQNFEVGCYAAGDLRVFKNFWEILGLCLQRGGKKS